MTLDRLCCKYCTYLSAYTRKALHLSFPTKYSASPWRLDLTSIDHMTSPEADLSRPHTLHSPFHPSGARDQCCTTFLLSDPTHSRPSFFPLVPPSPSSSLFAFRRNASVSILLHLHSLLVRSVIPSKTLAAQTAETLIPFVLNLHSAVGLLPLVALSVTTSSSPTPSPLSFHIILSCGPEVTPPSTIQRQDPCSVCGRCCWLGGVPVNGA